MEPIRHLYIHVPFCAKICPYCAFYVHRGGPAAQQRFLDALLREWQGACREFPLAPETIYLGGGTPSLLAPELFEQLRPILAARSGDQPEITLEVNPATVTPAKAAAWRAAGINRISLGAQSFDPGELALLGRQHAPEEIAETCALLRAHGFSNLSIDLMFALPGQGESRWEETLAAALACQPCHVSAYALTYEADTPFFAQLGQGLHRPDEGREIAMFQRTREVLAGAGLLEYEISNFARPGAESRHNLAYWNGADYLGLGPSACSTVGEKRWKNVPDTLAYQARLGLGQSIRTELERVDEATRRKERVMFGLRLAQGVPLSALEAGGKTVTQLTCEGLARIENDYLILTPQGRLVADSVALLFA